MISPLSDVAVARRVARDIPDGSYVNLGIGMPILVGDVVGPDKEIVYHSENGILGMGPAPAPGEEDRELINAGKQPVTLLPGGCYFHHTDAFVMMRGGHIDISVLGAFQVSETGDLANWITDLATMPPAVGGAMDLAVGAKRVLVMTTHTTRDGRPKLLPRCTYPLTAARVVDRVYTDLAVLDVGPDGLVVQEMAPGLTRTELQSLTAARLTFADDVGELDPH
ncbi:MULTISPECIES: 3-oxoacid CoA-transferase subunit B [unclassified Modestobacter]|uniref:3-oxoacid CoA-transferase subunit B n=1 Tax=unclassified Modestobacter TaxID=2643866 RepID=UPI0022AAFD0A|nr:MULTISPECIES: 3-oxoacid CoA-transferase subunit B [unclassified Modestobacter]MCZ2823132.1 3-oxoacid CoA-transferase subunit B [Modestobacter sp. VKM Ac-2981]MCZ2851378.1 3-oxoacid CoA-transferase subunit B [Modestobacter sp. VKM Ac-2982]